MANGRCDDHPLGDLGNGAVGGDREQGDALVSTLSQRQGARYAQVEGIGWPMSPECSLELKAQFDAVVVQALCRFRGLFDRLDVAGLGGSARDV